MIKKLLLLVVSLAVIHLGIAAKSDDISFVDAVDESEAIREKIRTEMDNYKKIKEMMFKNKLLSTTTVEAIESSSITESTTTVQDSTTVLQSESTTVESTESTTTEELPLSSSEPAIVSSSTIRQISLNLGDVEDDEVEDSPTDVNYDDTTITPGATNSSKLEDRFILNAPVICKNGQIPNHSGNCRKIVT